VTAAAAGVGVLRVPRPLVADELESGALVQVLADSVMPPGQSNYAVYPARDFLALKTAAFVDFLIEKIGHKRPLK
jgi:DNA-binding transcriptional LysR family regulator